MFFFCLNSTKCHRCLLLHLTKYHLVHQDEIKIVQAFASHPEKVPCTVSLECVWWSETWQNLGSLVHPRWEFHGLKIKWFVEIFVFLPAYQHVSPCVARLSPETGTLKYTIKTPRKMQFDVIKQHFYDIQGYLMRTSRNKWQSFCHLSVVMNVCKIAKMET